MALSLDVDGVWSGSKILRSFVTLLKVFVAASHFLVNHVCWNAVEFVSAIPVLSTV